MQRFFSFLRANPGLLAMVALLAIATLVGVILFALLSRSGQSPRSLVFFYVFFGIVVLPQFAYHLAVARGWIGEIPAWVPKSERVGPAPAAGALPSTAVARVDEAALAVRDGVFADPARVFGSDADPDLIRDAKAVFGDVLLKAETAQLAFFPSGETALAAIFPAPEIARAARDGYLRFFGYAGSVPEGTAVATGPRPSGDWTRAVLAGNALFAWTAPDEAALDRRQSLIEALQVDEGGPAAPETVAPPAADPPATGSPAEVKPGPRFRVSPALFGFLVAIQLAAAVLWFFKGSAWAAGTRAEPGATPVAAETLRGRLLAISETDVPFAVTEGKEPGTVEVTWRYADARWADQARLHGMRRAHKLVLRFDEEEHAVRAREFWGGYDWSAGGDGLKIDWRKATGIQFFQVDHRRVFGLQFDADGRPKAELSYAYTFNLAELKGPVIQLVTRSGWDWRPVVWDAPRGLRWATE